MEHNGAMCLLYFEGWGHHINIYRYIHCTQIGFVGTLYTMIRFLFHKLEQYVLQRVSEHW